MLTIRSILKDKIEINFPWRFLYGFKLLSGIEQYSSIPLRVLNTLLEIGYSSSDFKDHILMQAFYRKKIENSDMKTTEIYYFTYSERIRDIFKGSPQLKMLTGGELADVIYRLQTLDDEIVLHEKELRRTTEIFKEYKQVSNIEKYYEKLVKEAITNVDDYNIFFAVKLSDLQTVNWSSILQLDWEGVIWITYDFSNFEKYFDAQKLKNFYSDRDKWEELKEANKRVFSPIGMEIFIIGKKDKIPTATALTIGSFLGIVVKEKKFEKYKPLLETPLKYFDPEYELLDDIHFVKNLTIYNLEKYKQPKKSLVVGHNIYKTYQAFNPYEESSPFTITIAPAGSGKSVFLGSYLNQVLNIKWKEDIKKEVINIPPTRIRYFDKGFTVEVLFKLLKLKGVDVNRLALKPDEVRVNPLEIIDETTDFDFAIEFTSLILRSLNEKPLGREGMLFKKIHRILYQNPEKYCYILNRQLRDLKITNPTTYEKLRRDGFKDTDFIKDIVNTNPQKYYYLKQPTYSDMFRFLQNLSPESMLIEDEESFKTLKTKLQIVKEIEQFNTISELEIKNSQLILVDIDTLETSPYFVPIVAGILKRLLYFDKYNKPQDVLAFYFFDEAHALLRYEEFMTMLTVAIKEVRKFKISLNFATQNWTDIPPKIIANIPNRFFLSTDEERKPQILREYANHLGIDYEKDLEKLRKIYFSLPPFYMAVQSSSLFSLKLPVSKVDLEILEAKNPYFLIEDKKIAIVRDFRITKKEREKLEKEGYLIV